MGEITKDSIRCELEENTSYNADNLRLLLAEDFMHKKGFVFLEGSDDIKFFRKQLSPVTIGIEYYGTDGKRTGGKHGIEKLLDDESIQDDRVIGICDRDYSEESVRRMFYCDKCCLELMVVSDKDVWDEFCSGYYHGSEEYTAFLLRLLRELAPLSMLRKESARGEIRENARIKGIDFRKVRLGKYLGVNNINGHQIFVDFGWEDYYEHCLELAGNLTEDDLYEFTNGHDLYKILGMICEHKMRKGAMGEKAVRDTLYDIYDRENFVKTNLYCDLKNYQANRTWKYVD